MRFPKSFFLAPLLAACSGGTSHTTVDVPDTGPIPEAGPIPERDGSTTPEAGPIPQLDGSTNRDCVSTQSSSLSGVTIKFTQTNCGFTLAQAAAGIDLTYEIVVDHDIEGATYIPLDEGRCNQPTDGSGLTPMDKLADNGQSYSVFDVGGCVFGPDGSIDHATTIKAGTYPRKMHWDGRNWTGPSDTSNPEGAPFPAGTYTFQVDAQGTQPSDAGAIPYEVQGKMTVVLEP